MHCIWSLFLFICFLVGIVFFFISTSRQQELTIPTNIARSAFLTSNAGNGVHAVTVGHLVCYYFSSSMHFTNGVIAHVSQSFEPIHSCKCVKWFIRLLDRSNRKKKKQKLYHISYGVMQNARIVCVCVSDTAMSFECRLHWTVDIYDFLFLFAIIVSSLAKWISTVFPFLFSLLPSFIHSVIRSKGMLDYYCKMTHGEFIVDWPAWKLSSTEIQFNTAHQNWRVENANE